MAELEHVSTIIPRVLAEIKRRKDMFENAEIISSYSRAQAIEDGQLVEVPSQVSRDAGIKYPCAMSAALFSTLNPTKKEDGLGQDIEGRLFDMVTMFRHAIRRSTDAGRVLTFDFLVQRTATRREKVEVKAICGPGDTPEPVITFLLPGED